MICHAYNSQGKRKENTIDFPTLLASEILLSRRLQLTYGDILSARSLSLAMEILRCIIRSAIICEANEIKRSATNSRTASRN